MTESTSIPIADLSTRELEVLQQLANGLHREEIAHEMGISVLTYDSYRKNIRIKLKIKSQLDWGKVLIKIQNLENQD